MNSPMNVKGSEGAARTPIPDDIHDAVCVTVAGIGRQQTPYGDKDQLIIVWELPDLSDDEGIPRTLSGFYSLSLGSQTKPSNLRKLLEGWRGKAFTPEEERGFELSRILGLSCRLIVSLYSRKDGTPGNRIDGAKRAGSGLDTKPYHALVYYDAWDHNQESFEKLPEWIATRVVRPHQLADKTEPEYASNRAAVTPAHLANIDEDSNEPF